MSVTEVFVVAITDDIVFGPRLAQIAQECGAVVHVYTVARDAIQALRNAQANERIVFIDMQAPSIEGLELAQKLMNIGGRLRVIAFCHTIHAELVRRCKLAGVGQLLDRARCEALITAIAQEMGVQRDTAME